MQVEGSVALITGGVSGLGHGAAARVVAMGGRVVMMDINEEQGKAAQAELGDSSRFIVCDVSDPDQVTAAVDGAAGAFGSIDILVNAAGVAPAQRVLSRDGAMFDLDLFKFTVGVNLIGMFDVIRNTARVMAEERTGSERGTGRDRQRRLDCGLRRASGTGGLLGFEGGRGGDDPAPGS